MLALAVVCVLTPTKGWAFFIHGKEFLELCDSDDDGKRGMCGGIMVGAYGAYTLLSEDLKGYSSDGKKMCLPEEPDLIPALKNLKLLLRADADLRSTDIMPLLFGIIEEFFVCK